MIVKQVSQEKMTLRKTRGMIVNIVNLHLAMASSHQEELVKVLTTG